MPELPEVETTRCGLSAAVDGKTLKKLTVRDHRLRWPIEKNLPKKVAGQHLRQIKRRAKYLLLELETGTLIAHLGMSGYLRVLEEVLQPNKHDHYDLQFSDGTIVRYHDPRRFGSLHWTEDDPSQHKLLAHLGPEPLTKQFSAKTLIESSRKRRTPVKTLIGDNRVVVGVGNIYANEALFHAGIHPNRAANRIADERYEVLTAEIKSVLKKAIRAGGTTLKDFFSADGKPGYFEQKLHVYGRAGESCHRCDSTIRDVVIAGRRAFYCPSCQR